MADVGVGEHVAIGEGVVVFGAVGEMFAGAFAKTAG